jgi:hypothetical protein
VLGVVDDLKVLTSNPWGNCFPSCSSLAKNHWGSFMTISSTKEENSGFWETTSIYSMYTLPSLSLTRYYSKGLGVFGFDCPREEDANEYVHMFQVYHGDCWMCYQCSSHLCSCKGLRLHERDP